MKHKEGIYFPHAWNVGLARQVAKETHNPEYAGKLIPRSTLRVWGLFALRRSAVIVHNNEAVAHAGITFRSKKNGQKFEEVGAVMTWGEGRRNGYAKEVVTAIVKRRSKPGRRFFAIVDKENKRSIDLFENKDKLGSTRMDPDDVPKKRKYRKHPKLFLRKIGFDITHLARREARALTPVSR